MDSSTIDFHRDIQPILAGHCYSCHGPDENSRQADLRLDDLNQAMAKSVVIPHDADRSLLMERINSEESSDLMPPPGHKRPLNSKQKELLKSWIQQGADYASHWAFTPPSRRLLKHAPEVSYDFGSEHPLVQDFNPIDSFIHRRLKELNLAPNDQADRGSLLRRVTLDLTGLPPTPEELDQFLSDSSDAAYEKVVDRLLASTSYAERMTMDWLDLARYADTNGYNNDEDRTMWPWRDWVINAFHHNMPFDRFLIEQLAGDLLPEPSQSQLIATGFLRNQGHNTEGGIIQEEYRVEYVADRVHTAATVFLGLSMQCARCHDHKYDPISQKEYYEFYAFFNNLEEKQASYSKFVAAEPFIRVPTPEQQSRLDELVVVQGKVFMQQIAGWFAGQPMLRVDKLLAIPASQRSDEQSQLIREIFLSRIDQEPLELRQATSTIEDEIQKLKDSIAAVMVMKEMQPARETFVLQRGEYNQPTLKVSAGLPAALTQSCDAASNNRLGLAQWLVDPQNPLTARVAVNRWWQHYFGTGLVRTSEDFGIAGESPSHPELLDYLSLALIDSDWNVKALQKMIVMSATYRRDSKRSPDGLERDPENRWLARGPRFRLAAETVRDNALAISGLLQNRVGGPSVKPYQPEGLWEDVSVERRAKYVPDFGEGLYRRSLYTFWKRTCPPPSLMSFDAPNREVCYARRPRTNTPLQSLVLLNDPTYVEAARSLAEHMLSIPSTNSGERIQVGFRRCLAREATDEELAIMSQLLDDALRQFRSQPEDAKAMNSIGYTRHAEELAAVELAAWTIVGSTLLNLDEVVSKR